MVAGVRPMVSRRLYASTADVLTAPANRHRICYNPTDLPNRAMSKSATLPSFPARAQRGQRRHPLDMAEPIAWASAMVGTAVGLVSGQIAYGAIPVALALSSNLANRYRRLQQIQPQMQAVMERSQQLHEDLTSVRNALQALPITQRIQSLEEALSRVSEAVVQIQQHQEDLQNQTDRDREQIKEACTILKRGVLNLNNHANQNFEEIRGEIESVRLSLATLLETQLDDRPSQTTVENLAGDIARLQGQWQDLTQRIPEPPDLTPLTLPLQQQIDGLQGKLDGLDRSYAELVKPGLGYLARQTRKLQKQQDATQQTLDRVPSWLAHLDGQLEATHTHPYRLVKENFDYLLAALDQVRSTAIVVSPWLTLPTGEEKRFLGLLEAALQRNVGVSIGWGDPADIGRDGGSKRPITLKPRGWRYHPERDRQQHYRALPHLLDLKKRYGNLSLKLLGMREKLVACDGVWMLLGGEHLLCRDDRASQKPLGLYVTDPQSIATAIERLAPPASQPSAKLERFPMETVSLR